MEVKDIKALKAESGLPLAMCKQAIEYAETHQECTPMGYLKAVSFAVATPGMLFEDKVKMFSKEE